MGDSTAASCRIEKLYNKGSFIDQIIPCIKVNTSFSQKRAITESELHSSFQPFWHTRWTMHYIDKLSSNQDNEQRKIKIANGMSNLY